MPGDLLKHPCRLEVRVATQAEQQAAKVYLTQHAVEAGGIRINRRAGATATMWSEDIPFAVLQRPMTGLSAA